MNEVLNSIGQWFKEKTSSPLYWTFVLAVILWNWEFFYVLFWQTEENLFVPTIEYAQQMLLTQGWGHHFLYFLLFPCISTYLIVWWLPLLNGLAHRRHIKYYYQRALLADRELLEYEQKKNASLISLSEVKKEQAEVKEEIERHTSTADLWHSEFETFKKHTLYPSGMYQLREVVYDNSGKTKRWAGNQYMRIIDTGFLALIDTKGLVTIKGVDDDEKIELTEKGKFFMLKYLETSS